MEQVSVIDGRTGEVEREEAFRVALLALAYPGRAHHLDLGTPLEPPAAARLVFEAVSETAEARRPAGETRAILREGKLDERELLALPRGSAEFPESGSTVIFVPPRETPAVTRVRLHGPGIDGERLYDLPLPVEQIVARNEACANEPLGIDLLIVGPVGIVGLPRTTHVERAA